MDLKSDDIFNIELDPALLLSYELDKLNLESIPNDIFEFSGEIPKTEDSVGAKNDLSSLKSKTDETSGYKDGCKLESSARDKKDFPVDGRQEMNSRTTKRKKDINGNDEPLSSEHLHHLIKDLSLSEDTAASDSDNEANDEISRTSKLKERAPIRRANRQANRKRGDITSRHDSHDRSQFNDERLRFWSGSSQVHFNNFASANPLTVQCNLTSVSCLSEIAYTENRASSYEDIRAKAVSSPESGYDSSSATSITGSPPHVSFPTSYHSLDFIPELVDEQNILDIIAENTTEGALPDINFPIGESDKSDKISKIIDFLKDGELNESTLVGAPLNCIHDSVPLSAQDLNCNSVLMPSLTVAKSVEKTKNLSYKVGDKAKNTLKEFLCKEEYLAAQKRIYQKNAEDRANKSEEDVKIIYVNDKDDKASENRTNLHYAVLNSRLEEVYNLIEITKQFGMPLTDINIRDKYGKTALDYAIQEKMTLVVEYLKENTGCQSVNI